MSSLSFVTHEVSRMPFAGRHLVKRVGEGSIKERRTGPKIAKTLGGLAFMSLMIAGHAIQAKMGASEFIRNAEWYEFGDESLIRRAQSAYAAAYCGANAAVTAAQTYIGYRMGKSLVRNLRRPPPVKPFEVGIDTDTYEAVGADTSTRPFQSANACPAYEVGIENEVPEPVSRRSFTEWRKEHATPVRMATDTAVTLTGQTAIIASMQF